ncbi:MAG: AAA family ATPase, partial [Candidatus Binatia bacterium]
VGDGLLIYFGYPYAHEDDAVRAVHAGLGIIDELGHVNDDLAARFDVRLAVRIGIHSGPIVVGETGDGAPHQEQVLGHTMNLAARVQSVAERDTVVITDDTWRLVEGVFVCAPLGTRALRGVARPVTLHRVHRPSGVERRADFVRAARINPLVGRDQELAILRDRFDDARRGRGQAVLIAGEAGIGKSRLLRALRDFVATAAPGWLESRSAPYAHDSALYPVIQAQRQVLGLQPDLAPDEALERLAAAAQRTGAPAAEVVPLLATLHSLPLAPPYEVSRLSPEGQRRRTLELLADWLLGAAGTPGVLVFEDLHWFDDSTLELIGLLFERVRQTPVLIVLTHRPEFAPPWIGRHVTPVLLNRLTRQAAAQLALYTAGGRAVPEAWVAEVVQRTDGVPLFIEELTKALLEQERPAATDGVREPGAATFDATIPATLQDLLMARLDRLGPAKEVAQLGAALGRDFSYELLAAVALHDESSLRAALTRLVDTELLDQQGEPPQATYAFRHALLQEAAYGSLLKARRQRYHEQIARVLEQRFPAQVETQPELVAHHFGAAGLSQPAIGYWQRAAQRAMVRSANVEAARFVTDALQLLGGLPAGPLRSQQELGLRSILGMTMAATRGYGADEVERAFARAREICEEFPNVPQLVPVLYGLHAFYLVRADRRRNVELAEQLVQLTRDSDDAGLLFMSVGAAGITDFWQGDHLRAVERLSRTASLYQPEHQALTFMHGQEPGAVAHMYLGLVRWFLGYPEQALAEMDTAMAIAARTPHPLTLTMVTNFASDLRYFRREPEPQRALAERTVALSVEHSFPLWLGGAKSSTGWALVERGEIAEGVGEINRSLALTRATGSLLNRPFILAKLATAHLRTGSLTLGLEAADAGLALTATNLDRYWEPELRRIKGELLLAGGESHAAQAEAAF